jgi:hypothetical protein
MTIPPYSKGLFQEDEVKDLIHISWLHLRQTQSKIMELNPEPFPKILHGG